MKSIVIGDMCFDYLDSEAVLHRSPVPFTYDERYFARYEKRASTDMGRRLTLFRRAYVECFTGPHDLVLDYGTGYGDLVMKDQTGRWFGYDIMEQSRARLDNRFDGNINKYDAICFFDVLEHFAEPKDILDQVQPGAKVFVSMPVWSDWSCVSNIVNWRHWRPNEHLLYVSVKGLQSLMRQHGFTCVDDNTIETSLGRLDIATFCFSK